MKPTFLIPFMLLILLQSCTMVPAGIVREGTQGNIVQMGGQLALDVGDTKLRVNNEKSFDDATRVIDRGILSWATVKSLTRYFDSEDATTAANTATEKAKLSAGTEQARIAADKELALEAMKLEAEATPIPTP